MSTEHESNSAQSAARKILPSQVEIDLLAVFIETAEELRREPFFDLYETPRWTSQQDKLVVMEFGDRFHFRSALIPFRRLWRKGEDSYYSDILRLIAKHNPSAAPFAQSYSDAHRHFEEKPSHPPHVTLTGKEVIDGWLYSVFVHTNIKRSRAKIGDYDRRDFERNVQRFGQAWYEYAFRETVRHVGWLYFNILDHLAKPLLHDWSIANLKPSFQMMDAFGMAKREKTPDGTVIIRRSSSLYGIDETLIQKFFRLLRRFRSLEGILDSLQMSNEELLKAFIEAPTVRNLITSAGYELHLAEHYTPKEGDATRNATIFDSLTGKYGSYCSTRDQLLVASKTCLSAWAREFSELKALLLNREPPAYAGPRGYRMKAAR
jgi:hypothetical protein